MSQIFYKYLIIFLFVVSCSHSGKVDRFPSSDKVDLKLCIYSSYNIGTRALIEAEERMEADQDIQLNNDNKEDLTKFDRNLGKLAGDIMGGHVWVEVLSNNTAIKTYGFWPDGVLVDDEGDLFGGEFHIKEELKGVTVEKFVARDCQLITRDQTYEIDQLAKTYEEVFGGWRYLNNCIHFARHIYRTISGKKLKTLFPRPKSLYKKIKKINKE